MKKLIISISLLTILFSIPLHAEKMRIAIMDFQAKGVAKSLAQNVAELIRGEMINTDRFIVVERSQMNQILKEHEFGQTGCTDVSCAVEIGKILSAKKILIGTIMKMGGVIIITARIVDVATGTGEFSEKQKAQSEQNLFEAVTIFTKKLTDRIEGKVGTYVDEQITTEEEVIVVPEETYSTGKPYRHVIGANLSLLRGTLYQSYEDDSDDTETTITGKEFTFDYTFFLKPVEGMNLPNDLKEFILHPSKLNISANIGDEEEEYDEGGDSKTDWKGFNIGGEYYFPSRTGIAASYASGSATKKISEYDEWDLDIDKRSISLGVNQYLGNTHKLYFKYTNDDYDYDYKDSDYKWDRSIDWFYFGWAKATGESSRFLFNLEFLYGSGKVDHDNREIQNDIYATRILFGPAFSRFAIYFCFDIGVELSETEYEYAGDNPSSVGFLFGFGINPVFWFGDRFGLGIVSYSEMVIRDYDEYYVSNEIELTYKFEISFISY